MSVLPISVCLLAKNEADRLEKTLVPLAGKFTELLAYDDSSTDETVEILKNHGASVITGPWLGFSGTRKALWGIAKSEWILWLDADEIFSEETLRALERVGQEPDVAGYRVCRQVVFEGQRIRHGDWGRDWVLRIFKRDSYEMAERIVHESVTVPGRVVDLPGIVEHHSFRNWADLEKRSARYAKLWAEQAAAEGKKPGWPLGHAIWKFIRGFIVKSGWLDGALGYRIALHNAREVYDKYSQLRALRTH